MDLSINILIPIRGNQSACAVTDRGLSAGIKLSAQNRIEMNGHADARLVFKTNNSIIYRHEVRHKATNDGWLLSYLSAQWVARH